MRDSDPPERKNRAHVGKFTEGLLDNGAILNALKISAGQTILDAGCGNGYMAKLFAKQVTPSGKVIALDPYEHFIQILQQETRGSNIDPIVGDITQPTPINAASVDLIYLSTVIHGFSKEQIQGFVREVGRLLKPGAKLAIVEIEKIETSFGPPLELRYSPQDLKGIIPLTPATTVAVGQYFYMQVFLNTRGDVPA